MNKIKRRLWWLALAFAVMFALYVGSYAVLYNRGVSDCNAFGYSYFFYVPVEDIIKARDVTTRHVVLAAFYEPLHEIHRRYLGGRSACRGICFDLFRSSAPAAGK